MWTSLDNEGVHKGSLTTVVYAGTVFYLPPFNSGGREGIECKWISHYSSLRCRNRRKDWDEGWYLPDWVANRWAVSHQSGIFLMAAWCVAWIEYDWARVWINALTHVHDQEKQRYRVYRNPNIPSRRREGERRETTIRDEGREGEWREEREERRPPRSREETMNKWRMEEKGKRREISCKKNNWIEKQRDNKNKKTQLEIDRIRYYSVFGIWMTLLHSSRSNIRAFSDANITLSNQFLELNGKGIKIQILRMNKLCVCEVQNVWRV